MLRSSLTTLFMVALLGSSQAGWSQKRGSNPPPKTTTPSTGTDRGQVGLEHPTFVSGNVLLEGGGPPPEPVAIERSCDGVSRREGYTDSKGRFQLQIGVNTGFQDASESSSSTALSPRIPQRVNLEACEFRALLAGYESSTVMLRTHGNVGQFDVGTIFLKRITNVQGTTVSTTSLSAPKKARSAFEKGEKALEGKKLEQAEKELSKAVSDYPRFAAAWSLLGDVHAQEDRLDDAVNDYSQSLAADPQFLNPSFGLALVAMRRKHWQDAIHYTDTLLRLNASAFPSAYFYNAVAHYNAGEFTRAEENALKFKTVDTGHSHPDVCLLLSEILARKQDYAGAAKEAREFLALVPDSPNAGAIREKAEHLEQLSQSHAQ